MCADLIYLPSAMLRYVDALLHLGSSNGKELVCSSLLSISRSGAARYPLQAMTRRDSQGTPIATARAHQEGNGHCSCGFYARNQVNCAVASASTTD